MMGDLIDCLEDGPAPPLGTVVHVGAGAGSVLQDWVRLSPRRVVLVEGDPESAAELRAAARLLPWAEPVECVVAPADGEVLWHRFNLPRFNGPLIPDGLLARYPRLHATGERRLRASGLSALPAMAPAQGDERPDVLVLDLPGQEGPLLASLSAEQLQRFRWVLVRGCALDESSAAAAGSLAGALADLHYRPVHIRRDRDPLWPPSLYRLDVSRLKIATLRSRVDALQADLAKSRQGEARLRDELDRLAEERLRLAEADVRARARLRAECDGQGERLQALTAQLDALSGQCRTLTVERDDWRRAAEDRVADRQALQSRLQAESQRAAALEAEQRDAARRHALVQEELSRAEGQLDMIRDLLLRDAEP